ncbi:hypothetical protein OG738_40880 [Amycolatopsis sp. NBC_01488]|uniref:hypothetical protein n=1 Tax=Amycolatopsis sp. NBC_01488 TaxID=2903563 RepID=UPI002E2DB8E2|nr:hypothetical protein [Amycolatopsis sp. NBC_01488]
MNSIETALREVLFEGLDDWVPVDRVIGLAREMAATEAADFQDLAVRMIELLIGQGLMDAGDIGDAGFERWEGTPEEVVARVVAVCKSLRWEPFGEACWMTNTDKGNAQAQK